MRYKQSYQYDAVFALGFVTVYDQLMEGYPSDEDRDAIFRSYIQALQEDPDQYRSDAQKLEWARTQNAASLIEFSSREGEIEGDLREISSRAGATTAVSLPLASSDFLNLPMQWNRPSLRREKKKRGERAASQKAREAVTQFVGDLQFAHN